MITEADITPCRPAVGGCLLTNLAQATAFEPTGQEVASEQATATITVRRQQAAELTLAKRVVSPGPFRVGDRVVYAYTVTDTGDTALHDVAVTDDLVTSVTCDTTTLAAGASTTCHGTYTVTGTHVTPCAKSAGYSGGTGGEGCCEITNTAHATATDPQGDRITSNRATATIQVNGGKDGNCCEQHGGYGKTS